VAAHREAGAAATVLTARLSDPTGYGRVVRGKGGRVARIVEQADATAEELAVDEVNTSIYVFRRSVIAPALRRVHPDNAQGEYYLTDIVAVLHDAGYAIISLVVDDPMEISGVNDRVQLAAAETELRRRVNQEWLRQGVTMVDPAHTYLDVTVQLGKDVTLYPGTLLQGATTVASGAEIGPNSQLADCTVGERAVVTSTVGRSANVGADARVGPWGFLPPGSQVTPGTVTGPCFTGGTDDAAFG
jgi:bifunctional UDP-N-acetylglucosamine pyrophosphorylase / glucosamine-1-phosphate N-acetyltransferase